MTTSQPQIRQRNPFKFVSEIPELDQDAPDRVLDEQEQEQIIEDLKEEDKRISRLYKIVGLTGLAFSSLIQILVILRILGSSPRTRVFGLFNLALHVHAVLAVRQITTLQINPRTTVPILDLLPLQLFIFIHPIIALASKTHPMDWMFIILPVAATLLAWICLSAMKDGQKGIEELEKLKYDAKGA